MNLFRRSLAEDAVDRYTHTWSVMLLLVLTLVMWLLPFDRTPLALAPISPRYKAHCWCPNEFTSSHIMYVEIACSAAINQALGDADHETDKNSHAATVFDIPLDHLIPIEPLDRWNMRVKPKSDNKNTDFTYFISVKTPLILFIFAVCLKLPHVIWTVLSGFVGINIDQTLETAKTGQRLDKDSRYQLREDLGHAISKSAKSTSSSTSLLYLFFKLLMCVVVVAALVVVKTDLLPKVQNLEDEIAAHRDVKSSENVSITQPTNDYTNKPLLCDISIRQFHNVRQYTVQCVFSPHESSTPDNVYLTSNQEIDLMPQVPKEKKQINLGTYEALYTILLVYFVVLAIINVASLLIWCAKLVLGPCHQRVSSSTNLPMDFYLLLYMAQENVGHLVADYLAESFSRGSGGEKEEMLRLEDKNM